MRNFTFLLMLFVGFNGFSQKFSKEEKALILAGDVKTALPIYQTDNEEQHKVLLAQSKEISPKDKILPILIERMRLALAGTGGGVGIAAPQVGITGEWFWFNALIKQDFLWNILSIRQSFGVRNY